jgi:hypothetical protein
VVISESYLPVYPFSGKGRIAGSVTRLGVPGAHQVLLYVRGLMTPIRQTLSDADGQYAFEYLDQTVSYFVVAFDNTDNPVNAAISDYITPEPMDV